MAQKEKTVREHTRRTKSGKVVKVRQHKAKYDAAEEEARAAAKKKGAGKEYEETKRRVSDDSPFNFSADDYKEWYHWDTEDDPDNEAALRVEKELKKQMGARAYREYYDQMVDSYSERGHNKAYKSLIMSHQTEQTESKSDTTPKKEKKPKTEDAPKEKESKGSHTAGSIAEGVAKCKGTEAKMLFLADKFAESTRGGKLPSREVEEAIDNFMKTLDGGRAANIGRFNTYVGAMYDFNEKTGRTPRKDKEEAKQILNLKEAKGFEPRMSNGVEGLTMHRKFKSDKYLNDFGKKLESAGWKKTKFTNEGHPAYDIASLTTSYVSPDGKFVFEAQANYRDTARDNTFYGTFKIAKNISNITKGDTVSFSHHGKKLSGVVSYISDGACDVKTADGKNYAMSLSSLKKVKGKPMAAPRVAPQVTATKNGKPINITFKGE